MVACGEQVPPSSPTIGLSPSSLSFSAEEGGANPAIQTLTIWNSGEGTLDWVISDDAGWLTLNPSSGVSTGETDTITVLVDTYGMDAGGYSASIAVSASEASNSPRTIAVDLSIVPSSAREITLADAPAILDMSSDLPTGFEHLDAASEGMSNEDLGLGPEYSEVELFLREEPFLEVYAYMTIVETQTERAVMDELMRDEEQLKSSLLYWLEAGFVAEGMELPEVECDVTHPSIGELAAMVSGQFSMYGTNVGFEYLTFKNDKAYVEIYQYYLRSGLSLVSLANGINQRIEGLNNGFSSDNGLPSGMVKPTVGYVPQGWYCSADDPYGTYDESDGTEWGLIEYTDNVDYDFVMIFYGSVPPELKGKENDRDALIAKAIEYAIFEPTESETMVVADELAGWVKAYDPEYDIYNMKIVFVKGSTCVDIFTEYDATYEDEAQAMSLIDSINMWE